MGYENDIANLGLLSGGAQGFIKGLEGAEQAQERKEDRSYRKLEFEAKMRSEERERENQRMENERKYRNDAMDARAKGLMAPQGQDIRTANPNELTWDPAYIQMQQMKALATAQADPYGVKAAAGQKARAEAPYNNMPKDKQIQVDASSKHLENVNYIKKNLDATLAQLNDPKMSDDLKLIAARESIKTLNSTQGQDAVGAEEAKRLASLLEYKILPRIGEPGKTFGRDLPMFAKQVKNNTDRLGSVAEQLQAEIDTNMGRPTGGKLGGGKLVQGKIDPAQKSQQDMQAIEWAKKNPKDPRAAQILKANGL